MPKPDFNSCGTCRLRAKDCPGPSLEDPTRCSHCVRLCLECLEHYTEKLDKKYRHPDVKRLMTTWNKTSPEARGGGIFPLTQVANDVAGRRSTKSTKGLQRSHKRSTKPCTKKPRLAFPDTRSGPSSAETSSTARYFAPPHSPSPSTPDTPSVPHPFTFAYPGPPRSPHMRIPHYNLSDPPDERSASHDPHSSSDFFETETRARYDNEGDPLIAALTQTEPHVQPLYPQSAPSSSQVGESSSQPTSDGLGMLTSQRFEDGPASPSPNASARLSQYHSVTTSIARHQPFKHHSNDVFLGIPPSASNIPSPHLGYFSHSVCVSPVSSPSTLTASTLSTMLDTFDEFRDGDSWGTRSLFDPESDNSSHPSMTKSALQLTNVSSESAAYEAMGESSFSNLEGHIGSGFSGAPVFDDPNNGLFQPYDANPSSTEYLTSLRPPLMSRADALALAYMSGTNPGGSSAALAPLSDFDTFNTPVTPDVWPSYFDPLPTEVDPRSPQAQQQPLEPTYDGISHRLELETRGAAGVTSLSEASWTELPEVPPQVMNTVRYTQSNGHRLVDFSVSSAGSRSGPSRSNTITPWSQPTASAVHNQNYPPIPDLNVRPPTPITRQDLPSPTQVYHPDVSRSAIRVQVLTPTMDNMAFQSSLHPQATEPAFNPFYTSPISPQFPQDAPR